MPILTVATFKKVFDTERIDHLASLYDPVSETESYDETIVEEIIAQAEGYVKNTLSRSYTNAQIEADAGIERLTSDIAIYYLQFRRSSFTDDVEAAYERAIDRLEQLRSGEVKLAAVEQLLPIGETALDSDIDGSDFFDGLRTWNSE